MSQKKFNKICLVCGDKAIGRNFGALSCESCKQFFRRHSLRNSFQCHFGGTCTVDLITRKFCQKCRLTKCFTIGMKTDWILTEEQKEWRRMRIQAKRQTRNGSIDSTFTNTDFDNNKNITPETTNNSTLNTNTDSNLVELMENNSISDELIDKNLMEFENQLNNKRKNSDSSVDTIDEQIAIESEFISAILGDNYMNSDINTEVMEIENNITNTQDLNYISNDVCESATDKELQEVPIARPVLDCSKNLNEVELTILDELMYARNMIMQPRATITSIITNKDDLYKIMGFKFDRGIRNFVKSTKVISRFQAICEEDKFNLVKYGCIEVLLMRSILFFNFDSKYWTLSYDPDNSSLLNLEVLKNFKRNFYEQFCTFLERFSSVWDSDNVIIDLLTAIILFDPNRPNIGHKHVIKLQRHIYMYLLQRYLLLKCGSECEANETFLRLLNCLNDLNILWEIQKKNTLEDYQYMYNRPLIKEILDDKA